MPKDYYKWFGPKCKHHHLRLCFLYSIEIPKESATIAQWDEEEEAFFSVQRDDWLTDEEMEGLRWVHLPLPPDFKDEAEKPPKKPPLF